MSLFSGIGDVEREKQTLGTLARALVMAGDIDEGIELMRDLSVSTPNMAGLIEASTAVQLGDPDMAQAALALSFRGDPITGDAIGFGERGVAGALAELQLGKIADAVEHLQRADRDSHTDGERANARAALTVAYCAADEPDQALATADTLPTLSAGTYLDRMLATIGRGLAFVRLRRPDDAVAAFDAALEIVDATDDVLDQAITRLARAIAYETLDHPAAAAITAEAHRRLRELDIDALGWETAFRLAAGN
jgi:tetratricopeptide (TPR) repeat protein